MKLDALLIFRALIGVWLIVGAWWMGAGFDAAGTSDTVAGMAIIAIACAAARVPKLRLAQAAIGVWVMFAAVLLEPHEIQMYSEILTGKVLLISAAVRREMFGFG